MISVKVEGVEVPEALERLCSVVVVVVVDAIDGGGRVVVLKITTNNEC